MDNSFLVKIQWGVMVLLVGLLVAPYLVVHNSSQSSMSDMNMSAGMMQKLYPLDNANVPLPTVSFTLTRGLPDGWYLHITTTNFEFTPQNINQAAVADQGHVHLYIDGALTVVLGPWYHVPGTEVPPGKHTVTVALAANDHSEFADNGKPIEATQILYVY